MALNRQLSCDLPSLISSSTFCLPRPSPSSFIYHHCPCGLTTRHSHHTPTPHSSYTCSCGHGFALDNYSPPDCDDCKLTTFHALLECWCCEREFNGTSEKCPICGYGMDGSWVLRWWGVMYERVCGRWEILGDGGWVEEPGLGAWEGRRKEKL